MRLAAIAFVALASCGGSPVAIDAGTDAPLVNDAGPSYALPSVAARCAAAADRSTHTLAVTNPVPVLAIARGATDVGLAYVDRPPFPEPAYFYFQRLALDGTSQGDRVQLCPVDMLGAGPTTITFDGTSYFACTVAVGSAFCFRIDASGTSTADVMVQDATAIAVTYGIGGVMGAWLDDEQLSVGPLDAPPGMLAMTDATPSIAPTTTGYVVGYSTATMAYVVTLDATGHAATPIALGAALRGSEVAVQFTNGVIGASYVADDGAAMAAVITDGVVQRVTLAASAMSHGHVSIARATDGFFATWSDASGSIDGAFLDPSGASSGTPYMHAVGWSDDAHAVVALADDFLLVTNTTMNATPVDVAIVGCP